MSNKHRARLPHLLTILGIVLLGVMIAPAMMPPPVHAQQVGTVCIAPQGTMTSGCPSSPAVIVGSSTIGSHFIVSVNIQNSDALNGFRIFVKTDNTIINPIKADANNTLLGQPILTLANCVNGAGTGCSLSAGDGPGVVDVAMTSLAGLTIPPTTGGLFEIVYSVVSTTTGTPIRFLSGTSCGKGSSVPGLCITITNGGATPVEETAQTGTFLDQATFTVASYSTFVSFSAGSQATPIINVTSYLGFSGTISLGLTFNSTTNVHPNATLSSTSLIFGGGHPTSDNVTVTLTASKGIQAGGYNMTVTGAGGTPSQTRSVSIIVKVIASPSLTLAVTPSSIVVGNSVVAGSASLSQQSTNAGGTVTYTLFNSSGCTGSSQQISKVTISAGSIPDSRSLVMNNTGTFSFNATYSGDTYDNPASACRSFTVTKATPSLTTTLPAAINPNTSVSDKATLTGGFFGPATGTPYSNITGNVTYSLFTTSDCTGTSTVISTVQVNGNTGLVPDSRPVMFNATGTWSWNATYTGDANNSPAGNHACEVLVVKILQDFRISTSTSTTSFRLGTSSSVTLTFDSLQNFAGSVTITNTTTPTIGLIMRCTPNPVPVPAGGSASSTCTFSATSVGTYSVVFNGTSTSPPLTHLASAISVTVTQATPTTTTQIYYTNNTLVPLQSGVAVITNGTSIYDKPTLQGAFTPTGKIKFEFFNGGSCTGFPTASATLSISSGTLPNFGSPDLPVLSTPGNFSIQATYDGDGNNTATSPSPCEPLVVNNTPVALFAVSSAPYITGLNVIFNATSSFDPDALTTTDNIISYSWDFGDGSTGTGVMPSHSYTNVGSYTIILTVADRYSTATTSASIKVDSLIIKLTSSLSATSTTVGQILTYNVDAKNSGTLDLSMTVLLDVNGMTVDHKDLTLTSGQDSGSFTLSWNTTQFNANTYNVSIRIANAKTVGTSPTSVTVPSTSDTTQTAQVTLTSASPAFPLPGGATLWTIILGVIVVGAVAGYLLLRRRGKVETA